MRIQFSICRPLQYGTSEEQNGLARLISAFGSEQKPYTYPAK